MSSWATSRTRRICDVIIAVVVLAICVLPMMLVGLAVRLTSAGRALFFQERMGRGGRPFRLVKFRSMTEGQTGPGLSRDGDVRITRCGRILRRFKLDELPQFFNVLKGEMSLVGPRPKLPQFAAIRNMPYRPGITGLASLAFREEEQILASVVPERLESFYDEQIKPLKANLDVCYMCRATAASDLRILVATAAVCLNFVPLQTLLGGMWTQPAEFARSENNSGD